MPIIQTEAEINGSLTYSLQEIESSWYVGYDSAASMLVSSPEAAPANELSIDPSYVFTMPVSSPSPPPPPTSPFPVIETPPRNLPPTPPPPPTPHLNPT